MSDISSINFEKSIPINTQHNERIIPPSYLISKNFEVNRSSAEALALKQSMINRAIENYNKHKKPKAPPFKAKSYEWSAVVNLKPSSTMQDLENLAQHLQDKYGFQCYQIAIHKDEGHKDEDGNEVLNLHAHLEFITLDKDTGINKFNRRDIKYQTLRDIQTETAQILGMRRGIDKRLSGAERIKTRLWAKMKESEKGERKATQAKIKELQSENFVFEVSMKGLQEQTSIVKEELGVDFISKDTIKKAIEQVRVNEMKGKGFDKAAFDYLSEFKKGTLKRLELDEKITNEQFFKELDEFKRKLIELKKLKERVAELETKNAELKQELDKLRKENADLRAENQAKTAENQKLDKELDYIVEFASNRSRTLFSNAKKYDKELFDRLYARIPNDKKAEVDKAIESLEKQQSSQSKVTQKTQNTGIQK